MAKNTTDFNINVVLNSAGAIKGANKTNVALGGMGKTGRLAALGVNASMLKMAGGIGVAVVAVGTLSKVLTHAISVGKDFEQSMGDVRAILGTSNEEFRLLSQKAQELGSSTKFTATQVAGLAKELGKLGFGTQEILDATEGVLNLAAAVGSDISRAAEVAGSTLRAFTYNADQSGRVADVMAKSFTTSALDMEKFAESMKYVAPIAGQMGFSIEQTTALIGNLANVGISGSMAGTGLSQTLLQLGKKGSKLNQIFGKQIRTWDELVEAFTDAKEQGGLTNKQMDLMPPRLAKIIPPLIEASDKLLDYEKTLDSAGGSAERMAEIQMDTLQGSLTELNSAWEGFGIVIFEDVLPQMKPLIDGLTSIVQSLTGWLSIDMSEKLKQDRKDMNLLAQEAIQAAEGTETRKKAIEELQIKYPEYFKNLDAEKTKTEDLATAIENANRLKLMEIAIEVRKEEIGKLLEPVEDTTKKLEEKRLELIEKVYEFEQEFKKQEATLPDNLTAFGSSFQEFLSDRNLSTSALFDPVLMAERKGLEYYKLTSEQQFELLMNGLRDANALILEHTGRTVDFFTDKAAQPTKLADLRDGIAGSDDFYRNQTGVLEEIQKLAEKVAEEEAEVQPIIDRINRSIDRIFEKIGKTKKDLGMQSDPVKIGIVDVQVKQGDTLSILAERYGTTVEKIKEMNEGLIGQNNLIKEGIILQIDATKKLNEPRPQGDADLQGFTGEDTSLDEAINNYQSYADAIKQIEFKKGKSIYQQKLAQYDREYDLLKTALDAQQQLEIDWIKDTYDARAAAGQTNLTLEQELTEAETAHKQENANLQNTIETMKYQWKKENNQLTVADETDKFEALKRLTGTMGTFAKITAIKEATISMWKGANASYAALASIPIIGPALAIAARVEAITSGLASIKNISKQKFAKGGAVTSPTLAMIGEAGEEEFVAPKQQFSEWANNTLGLGKFNDGNIVSKLDNIESAINNQSYPSADDIADAVGSSNRGRLS